MYNRSTAWLTRFYTDRQRKSFSSFHAHVRRPHAYSNDGYTHKLIFSPFSFLCLVLPCMYTNRKGTSVWTLPGCLPRSQPACKHARYTNSSLYVQQVGKVLHFLLILSTALWGVGGRYTRYDMYTYYTKVYVQYVVFSCFHGFFICYPLNASTSCSVYWLHSLISHVQINLWTC